MPSSGPERAEQRAETLIATPRDLLDIREGDMAAAMDVIDRLANEISDQPVELVLRECENYG